METTEEERFFNQGKYKEMRAYLVNIEWNNWLKRPNRSVFEMVNVYVILIEIGSSNLKKAVEPEGTKQN